MTSHIWRSLALAIAVVCGNAIDAQQPMPIPTKSLPPRTKGAAPTTNAPATIDLKSVPQAPPAGPKPTGVTATVLSPISIKVTWTAVPNAVGYLIMRRGFNVTPTPVTGTQYIDTVIPNATYWYDVAAVYAPTANLSPGISDNSPSVSIPHVPPPQGLRVVPNGNAMQLSWQPVVGASGYGIIRDNKFLTSINNPVRGTSYVDQNLPPGTYTYLVASFEKSVVGTDTSLEEGDLKALKSGVKVSTPIWGFADTHTHPFANQGFGGKMFWGRAFGPIDKALAWCDVVHGAGGLGDLIGNAARGTLGHKVGGYPQFDGWPVWNTLTHQQMYVDWIYRAYQGGLRLMVAHAVNNGVLCALASKLDGRTCDDMENVQYQLDEAHAMESYIDAQSGGPGKGWFRIAYTPDQARQIIYSGRLAVVLGIEVDQLFGCSIGQCDAATVDQKLNNYYQMGVRHILPVHFADNAFGGYALQSSEFKINNWAVGSGAPPPASLVPKLLNLPGTVASEESCTNKGYQANCNARGLTPLGIHLIGAMMDRGMIIDIDHMSWNSINQTLTQTHSKRYPVIAGHTGILGVSLGNTLGAVPDSKRNEGQKTDAELAAIREDSGLVSIIVHQGNTDEIGAYRTSWGRSVPNDCGESSKSWAQAYLYAVDKMGGPNVAAVGLATDQYMNSMAGPRFGPDACSKKGSAGQQSQVQYPFATLMNGLMLGQSSAGQRTFNYNVDGLAHYGLLPDFIQDLQNDGLTKQDLGPLFRSAEAYIQMWERAVARSVRP
jgi:microsomal dipeptidase-like Zn-dependent dipeptidase